MSTFVLCHPVLLVIDGIAFVKKVVDLFPRLHIIMLFKIKTFIILINV